jgi:fatty acid-binding protein DegV
VRQLKKNQLYQKVRKEQKAFNKLLPGLLNTRHKNKWVVFRNGKVISYHNTATKAYNVGLKKFGVSGAFVIDQVVIHTPLLIY